MEAHSDRTEDEVQLLSPKPNDVSVCKKSRNSYYCRIITTTVLFLVACSSCFLFASLLGTLIYKQLKMIPTNSRERALYLATQRAPILDGHNDLVGKIRDFSDEMVLNREKYPSEEAWKKDYQFLFETVLQLDKPLASQDENYLLSNLNQLLHTNFDKAKQGQLRAQFWSIWTPCPEDNTRNVSNLQQTLEQFDILHQMLSMYPDHVQLVTHSSQIMNTFTQSSSKIASLIGVEGGHMINNSIPLLREYYNKGARYMTLTHTCSLSWVAASTIPETQDFGLSDTFGVTVIEEMNKLGMIIDLAHVSFQAMRDVLAITKSPVMFSHSGVYAICQTKRNVPNDVIAMVKQNNGIIMVPFYPPFIHQVESDLYAQFSKQYTFLDAIAKMREWEQEHPFERANVTHVVDHMDYIRQMTNSCDHIGIGSDFDGIRITAKGLEDVSQYLNLIEELLQRGYSDECVEKIMSKNLIRVLQQVETIASQLQQRKLFSVDF